MGSLLHCRCLGVLSLQVSIILLLIFPWLQKSAQVLVVYVPMYLWWWCVAYVVWRGIRETDTFVIQLDEQQGNLLRLIVWICTSGSWFQVEFQWRMRHRSQRTNKRLALQKTQGRRMPKDIVWFQTSKLEVWWWVIQYYTRRVNKIGSQKKQVFIPEDAYPLLMQIQHVKCI